MKIGAGKTTGETLYELYTTTGLIIPVGTCPSVGVGGYIQGGGFGTLAGELGLLSDNIISMKAVTARGEEVTVSEKKNGGLFWGLRGGGGGQLAIVTEFGVKVFEARDTYDENVYFGFTWDNKHAGEALYEWTKYAMESDGSLYIRMTSRANRQGLEVRGVGVCWKVNSLDACKDKLKALSLWNVEGRSKDLMRKSTQGVIEAQKFFTSDGQYATAKPGGPSTTEPAMKQRFVTKGFFSDKSWSSLMWDERMMSSSPSYFEGLLELMQQSRLDSDMRSVGMEFYPLGQRVRKRPESFSAFAHRHAIAVLAVFYTGGEVDPRLNTKRRIQDYLSPFGNGTYVNYQDIEMPESKYKKEYWGSSLERMKKLKKKWDPKNRLWHPQPV